MAKRRTLDKRLYYAVLLVIAAAATFALFARRQLHLTPAAPSTSLGRQAFQVAWQAQTNATAQADESNWDEEEDPWASNYYEPGVYDPDSPNSAPLVEIAARACLWPPTIWDVCIPDSTAREDAIQGPWIRVDRDLDRRESSRRQRPFQPHCSPQVSVSTTTSSSRGSASRDRPCHLSTRSSS